MSSSRLAITAAALIAAFGIHSASALEIDNANGKNPAANLADPDDNVPVAHLDDDGSVQQSSTGFNLQVQGGTQSGGAFGFGNSGPNAFDRAQQNQMGQ